jgi:imidazolonepropionase
MNQLGIIPHGHVGISDGRIIAVSAEQVPAAERVIDAQHKVLMPGLVDCHTHACWAGERLNEWARRLAGVSYLDILASGGGIMSTVRAVRDTDETRLSADLLVRIDEACRAGTTTLEVKSGYGLSTHAESKMLRAIAAAAKHARIRVIPTALLGHAIDPQINDFVATTISHTLPEVTRSFPGLTIDAFCETGAWSVEDCAALFSAARMSSSCASRGHTCTWRTCSLSTAANSRS